MYLNHFPHVNNGLLFVRFMILFLILYDIYIKIYFSWAKLRASSFDITVLACTLGHFCICVHVAIWQRPLLHVVLLYLDFKVWGASIVFFFRICGEIHGVLGGGWVNSNSEESVASSRGPEA